MVLLRTAFYQLLGIHHRRPKAEARSVQSEILAGRGGRQMTILIPIGSTIAPLAVVINARRVNCW